MDIGFLGHACLLLTDDGGRGAIIDPQEKGAFGGPWTASLEEGADAVPVSHGHADRSYVRGVPGIPIVLKDGGEALGVVFRAAWVSHERRGGRTRGTLAALCVKMDGVLCCHLGDTLTAEQAARIGPADVLMVPVGGTYAIDETQAWQVVAQLRPRIIIPMHYRTERTSLPMDRVAPFVRGRRNVCHCAQDTLSLTKAGASGGERVVVVRSAEQGARKRPPAGRVPPRPALPRSICGRKSAAPLPCRCRPLPRSAPHRGGGLGRRTSSTDGLCLPRDRRAPAGVTTGSSRSPKAPLLPHVAAVFTFFLHLLAQ